MPTQLWRTSGTSLDDFIVLTDGSDTVNGGTGDDLIIGDGPPPFTFGTTDSQSSPANLDSPLYWSTLENPLFGDASIPHTSLFVRGDAGQMQYASVTVGAGQTITIDIDFGAYGWIGSSENIAIILYDSMGNPVSNNDTAAYFSPEGAGSAAQDDPFLTFTNPGAMAETYTIGFMAVNGSVGPFVGGEDFVANISVTNHDVAPAVSGNDVLVGGDGNDTIIGQGGDDNLYGRAGNDDLFGGSGNDLIDGGDSLDTAWYMDAASAVFIDLRQAGPQNTGGAGIDTLISIEGIRGSAFGDVIMGNDDFNVLQGLGGDDTLLGYGSQDLIYGGAGADTLFGGDGDDTLRADEQDYSNYYNNRLFGEAGNDTLNGWLGDDYLSGGDGDDTIYEAGGNDTIDGGSGIDELQYWGGLGPVTVDLGIKTAQVTGQGTDTIVNVENLLGTSGNDTLTGDANANRLNGWWGNDSLHGGGGNDRLIGDTGDDTLDGGAGSDTADYGPSSVAVTVNLAKSTAQDTGNGIDTLISIENVIGSSSGDTLYGSTAANVMDGGAGNDQINGQGGNDTLLGNVGNDVLNGGNGDDLLDGGDGSDTASYAGNSIGVTVSLAVATAQNTGAGNDTLVNIENLTGTSFADSLTGDVNANRINGGAGADTMAGGGGNDIYIVDNGGDIVTEAAGGGNDTVNSTASFHLGANVEKLILTGSANVDATGNSTANVLTGNGGINILSGGLGNDTLTGGGGADLFRFDSTLNGVSNVDKIADFAAGSDRIQLDDDIFTTAGAIGALGSAAFFAGTAAHDSDDRIIYNSTTGNIYYDADGNGAGAAILFAQVTAGTALTNADFEIIG